MVVRRWSVVLIVVVLFTTPRAARAQQQSEICNPVMPTNIDAGLLAPDMAALLRRSDTFRSQCARVAAARVRVKLEVVNGLDNGRAQTAIHRYPSGALRADVWILFGENYRELLPHEFEHILEQIEGVNLRAEAAQGRAWVLQGGAFETRRAFEAGVQVLRELEALHAPAPVAVHATR